MEGSGFTQPSGSNSNARRPIRRVPLACIQCRSRKVKCDATQPVCTRCQVDGKQCEYHKSRRGGRPRRPAPAPVQHALEDPSSCEGWIEVVATGTDSNSSRVNSTSSSSKSVSDTLEILPNQDFIMVGDTMLSTSQVEQLLGQYYVHFHVAHPCVLPHWSLRARLTERSISVTLLPVLLYIGSIFTHTIPSDPLADAAVRAINSARATGQSSDPYYVQALTLYSIAVYWCNEPEYGRVLLDEAIRIATDLKMYESSFATLHGGGDKVLEESWRRTWWLLYITDAHIAGSTHSYPTQTGQLQISVGLPCEEERYDSGNIPATPSLRSYDVREFSEAKFSSFAHLVGFTLGINRVLSFPRLHEPAQQKIICANADTMMTAWCSLLPKDKRRILRDDGSVDELLFKANILMHTLSFQISPHGLQANSSSYIVDLHRELSNLQYSPIESVSKCAPPPPPESNNLIKEDAHTHTTKVLYSADKLTGLLTLPTKLTTHTPFIICMISNITIAHLSACRFVIPSTQIQAEREKIRLNMGVLKMMGEFWPAGQREYREMGIIAREILSLTDEEIQVPKERTIVPLDTLDFNFDFDIDWACDMFANGGPDFSAHAIMA